MLRIVGKSLLLLSIPLVVISDGMSVGNQPQRRGIASDIDWPVKYATEIGDLYWSVLRNGNKLSAKATLDSLVRNVNGSMSTIMSGEIEQNVANILVALETVKLIAASNGPQVIKDFVRETFAKRRDLEELDFDNGLRRSDFLKSVRGTLAATSSQELTRHLAVISEAFAGLLYNSTGRRFTDWSRLDLQINLYGDRDQLRFRISK